METETLKRTDLIKVFAEASKRADITLIESILDDQGVYEIQLDTLDTLEVGKSEFMKWYKDKLENVLITEIAYDHCLYCSLGKSVVLFNGGLFPRIPKDISERTKAGIMVNTEEDRIIETKFCLTFAKTDNDYICKSELKRMIENLAPGVPMDKAFELVTGHKPKKGF